jgi:hypothetical protein
MSVEVGGASYSASPFSLLRQEMAVIIANRAQAAQMQRNLPGVLGGLD